MKAPAVTSRQIGAVFALLAVCLPNPKAAARGSIANEMKPWAAEHISGLPVDIHHALSTRERACGNTAAAGHYFSTSIEISGLVFRLLHFAEFACQNRAMICNHDGCLHEVYLETRSRYRRVFSTYASDLRMGSAGGVPTLEVTNSRTSRSYRWNGRQFVPAGN